MSQVGGEWRVVRDETRALEETHQIAIFDGFCNDCGNCDVFCPEDGGPNLSKPRFFPSEAAWRRATIDGYHVTRASGTPVTLARRDGREYRAEVTASGILFDGPGFSVVVQDPARGILHGRAEPGAEVDLLWLDTMTGLNDAVLSGTAFNWISQLESENATP
jgi:putative selenate reductase